MRPSIPPRPADTSPEAEQVQIGLLRAAPVSRRLRLAWSLSAAVIGTARRALARSHPDAAPSEHDLRFVEIHYGRALAAGVRRELANRLGGDRRADS